MVVGSLVMDLICSTRRFPESGETVIGMDFQTAPGGKGANQAVQAARLGASVNMIGKVGNDDFGKNILKSVSESGVDVSGVSTSQSKPTAIGNIQLEVSESGTANRILVIPGANMDLSEEDVLPLRETISKYDMVILQLEIPVKINELVAKIAYENNFHAQFRRVNPLPYKEVYTIVDGIKGRGHYVGTHMLWSVKNNGWWGEGEIKFYIDGDENPTICGTGTEDYFCGSYNFEHPETHKYAEFTTPYSGLPLVVRPDGLYNSQQKFSMYRWHITDPIIFEENLKVTIQALGWRDGGRYLPLQDDISSVAYWYQTLPTAPFPPFPSKDELEII